MDLNLREIAGCHLSDAGLKRGADYRTAPTPAARLPALHTAVTHCYKCNESDKWGQVTFSAIAVAHSDDDPENVT
jgi:hypothetical protein